MKLPAGAGTGAILGVLFMAAMLFAVPGGKSDKLQPIAVKPIAMVPAPAPEPPVLAPAPEPPPIAAATPPSIEPPPAKPGLHPRPHDKSPPVKTPPPALPPQPPPVVTLPAQPKPAAAPAKPSAWQCFKLRQMATGMTPAEQQDYAAKYLTPAERAAAKTCLGTK